MKFWIRSVIAVSVGIVTMLVASVTTLVDDIEYRVSDLWLQIRGAETPAPGVVVIAIDEASYRELNVPYGPPWPRSLHAKLLHKLHELGAKRVVFDVLFVGPGADPQSDQELAEGLALVPSVIGVEASMRYIQKQGGGYMIEDLEQPFEPFRKVAKEALIGLRERQGVIRSFPVARSDQERKFPFLAYAGAGLFNSNAVANSNAAVNSTAAGLPGPYDLIRYYGPGRTLSIFSYWELLSADADLSKELFKDSVVFIGLLMRSDTGGSQKDSYVSPYGPPLVFGLEVHATIAANLINGSWIQRPPPIVERLLGALLAVGATFLSLSVSPVVFGSMVGGLIVLWSVAAFIAIQSGFFLAGAPIVLIELPVILLCSALYSYLSARRSAESLRCAFSLYVSPDMVPKLQSEGGALKLGGEKLWITALFTDIADFTTISEGMPAEKTSEMLNAYFTEVVEVVFNNQGTLLKFIGDAIFAIWGAPIKLPNHAELAIKAAISIQKELAKFNATQRFPALLTRIGIHTGPMLVGNLGSQKRFDYTAIGDSVNLAARVEGLNKYFGTNILLTEATIKDAGGFAGVLPIATVRVKGRTEPVRLFTIFDPPLELVVLADWNGALKLFVAAKFSESCELFAKIALQEKRLAKTVSLYKDESEQLQSLNLPQGWAGELDFEVK